MDFFSGMFIKTQVPISEVYGKGSATFATEVNCSNAVLLMKFNINNKQKILFSSITKINCDTSVTECECNDITNNDSLFVVLI